MHFFSFASVFLLLAVRGLATDSALDRLVASMAGAFLNTAQARGDQNFREVELQVAPIWPELGDGRWLYVEQSLAGAPQHPYKQLIYQLASRPDDTVELRIFDLPDPVAATGAWKDHSFWLKLAPDKLVPRPGCVAILHPQPDGSFKGGTEGQGCTSEIRDVSYVTLEIVVSEKQFVIWERGFNPKGVQVWGSLHGGYEFKKP